MIKVALIWILLLNFICKIAAFQSDLEFGGSEYQDQQESDLEDDFCSVPQSILKEEMLKNLTKLREQLEEDFKMKMKSLTDNFMDILNEQLKHQEECQNHLPGGENNKECLSPTTNLNYSDIRTSIPTCESKECMQLASRMLHMMNHSVDPCEDFYEYSCGRAEDNSHLSPIDIKLEINRRVKKMLKSQKDQDQVTAKANLFYDSCTEWFTNTKFGRKTEGTKKFAKEIIRKLGYFDPSVLSDFESGIDLVIPYSNITSILTHFLKQGFFQFFDVFLELDDEYPNKFIPSISLPLKKMPFGHSISEKVCLQHFNKKALQHLKKKLSLDLNEEYRNYVSCVRTGSGMKARLDRMVEVITELQLMDHVTDIKSREKLIQDTKQRTEFLLTDINGYLSNVPKHKNALNRKNYQMNTIEDLDIGKVLGQGVVWQILLRDLKGSEKTNLKKIRIYHQKELAEILTILDAEWKYESKGIWNVLLMLWTEWIYSILIDSPYQTNSEEFCIEAIKYLMPEVASDLYVRSHSNKFISDARREIEIFSKIIKHELVSHAEKDSSIGNDIKHKLETISLDVGGANTGTLLDNAILEHMKKVNLSADHHVNLISLLNQKQKMYYSFMNENLNSTQASSILNIVPYETTPIFIHEINQVYLPLGFFADSYYYQKSFPQFINFGGIGNSIASTIMKSLDGGGMKFDGEDKKSLTLPNILIYFSECLTQQILHTFDVQIGEEFSSKITFPKDVKLDDLLTTSGGIRLSWWTYQQSKTNSKDVFNSTAYNKEALIWLGSKPLEAVKAFFIVFAQSQCSRNTFDNFDFLSLMENNQLPPRLRVNLALKNEELFSKAFKCKHGSQMMAYELCPFFISSTVPNI